MASFEAGVLWGVNGIYTVEAEGRTFRCRIKGKVLKVEEREHGALAVGDRVECLPDPVSPDVGWIVSRLPRRTRLSRWKRRDGAEQVIAANADILACVASAHEPPFRPRFLDRLLIAGLSGGLSPLVILNKIDTGVEPEILERLRQYRSLGYGVHFCSVKTGEGIRELEGLFLGRTAVLAGQSGVGKSSLLNSFDAALMQKTGGISAKHDRGCHTTTYGRLFVLPSGARVIDTPGVREIQPAGIAPEDLAGHFPEFAALAPSCLLGSCLHDGEPGCAVRAAAESGAVHEDRYESYLRILYELRDEST